MKLIIPLEMTNAQLLSSNVTEDDYSEWDISTTYDADEYVIVIGSTHKVYQSVQDTNLGNDPTTDDGTWWTEISATNRWKAFDQKISDQVSQATTITYTIQPASNITGIALFNLDAESVRVQIDDNSSPPVEVYDVEREIIDTEDIVDWYTYFSWVPDYDTEALFIGIPGYSTHEITITISSPSGTAKVGQIVLGYVYTLGDVLEGTTVGIEDYSTKDRDAFGNAIITERAFADVADIQFSMNASDVRRVKRLLSSVRATPAVFFADEDLVEYGMTIYGLFNGFEIPLRKQGKSIVQIEVEGLI